MRAALTACAIAFASLAPAAAGAGHGGSERAGGDFVVGAGSSEFALGAVGEASFALHATSDPSGARPAGYVTSRGDPDGIGPMEPFTARGPVTCLRVDGNRATIKWRIEHGTGSAEPFEGGGVQSFLEDNGQRRRGNPPDRAALDPPQPAGVFDLNARLCDDPDTRATYDPLERGDVTVQDAVVSPAGR